MVSRDVNHARAFAGFAQDLLDDIVVLLRPIEATPQLPEIDQIADDVERLHLIVTEEIEKGGGIAAARAEMEIGNPGGADVARGWRFYQADVLKPASGRPTCAARKRVTL